MSIEVRTEARRGCGFRKPGGLYLVGGQLSAPCGRLPRALGRCPTCGGGIKFCRGWQWINPAPLFKDVACRLMGTIPGGSIGGVTSACQNCALGDYNVAFLNCQGWDGASRAGLLWVGASFYPTPEDYLKEAGRQGVSRRIKAVPRGFELGRTWVLLAHVKGMTMEALGNPIYFEGRPQLVPVPAIFAAFRPQAIEYVVKGTETEEEITALEARGFTCVEVHHEGEQKEMSL